MKKKQLTEILFNDNKVEKWDEWLKGNDVNITLTFDYELFEYLKFNPKERGRYLRHAKTYHRHFTTEKFLKTKGMTNSHNKMRIYNPDGYEDYRKSQSNKRKSPYDVEWVMERDNVTYDEAVAKVEKFKSDKATSKEKFIKRHGAEKGLKVYQKFALDCSKRYRIDYYLEKYKGDYDRAVSEYESFLKEQSITSKRTVGYYTKRGYSKDQAIEMVSKHQKMNAGVHIEYYLSRGYSEYDARLIIQDINKRKINKLTYSTLLKHFNLIDASNILRFAKHCYNKDWSELRVLLDIKSMPTLDFCKYALEIIKNKIQEYDESLNERDKYYQLVWLYTNLNDLSLLDNYDLRGRDYHLDHIYSIREGFKNGINPQVIGSIHNLRIIPASENCSKRANCDITIEELLEKFKESK
jgi:hypothetical protein